MRRGVPGRGFKGSVPIIKKIFKKNLTFPPVLCIIYIERGINTPKGEKNENENNFNNNSRNNENIKSNI